MTRKYKRLEELEIWDDFMFGAVMSNKELCKHLLEIILQKKIKDIRYTELQKTIDLQYDAKSIRLDVYVEDDLDSVYNIEIQTTDEKNLPKRSRFYQGMIDLNILNKGESYNIGARGADAPSRNSASRRRSSLTAELRDHRCHSAHKTVPG